MATKTWTAQSRFGYRRVSKKNNLYTWRNKLVGVIKLPSLPFADISHEVKGWITLEECRQELNSLHSSIYIDTTAVIAGWKQNGLPIKMIEGEYKLHYNNLTILKDAFLNNLILDLPAGARLIEEMDTEVEQEQVNAVKVTAVTVPENPTQEDKFDLLFRIVGSLTQRVEQLEAGRAVGDNSQMWLGNEGGDDASVDSTDGRRCGDERGRDGTRSR